LPSLAACTHFLASQPSYHSTHAQPALSGEWLLLLVLALSASAQAASDLVSTSPQLPLAHRQIPPNTFLKPYLGHSCSSHPSLCAILPTHSNSSSQTPHNAHPRSPWELLGDRRRLSSAKRASHFSSRHRAGRLSFPARRIRAWRSPSAPRGSLPVATPTDLS